jgi:hypothetical protein
MHPKDSSAVAAILLKKEKLVLSIPKVMVLVWLLKLKRD